MIERVSPGRTRDAAISLSECNRKESGYKDPVISRKLKNKNYISYLYKIGKKYVAIVTFTRSDILEDTRFNGKYELSKIYTLPDYRNRGIATALQQYAFDKIGDLCEIEGKLIILLPISPAARGIITRIIIPKYPQIVVKRDLSGENGCRIGTINSTDIFTVSDKLGDDSVLSSAFPMSSQPQEIE